MSHLDQKLNFYNYTTNVNKLIIKANIIKQPIQCHSIDCSSSFGNNNNNHSSIILFIYYIQPRFIPYISALRLHTSINVIN